MIEAGDRPREREATASFLLRLRASGIRDLAVLRAMETVPRAAFVPHRYADLAVRDIALPIGCGQTMAEPSFVARQLEALGCGPAHRVLEVGTGSGYVTALLSQVAREVVTIERFQTLAIEARTRLSQIGLDNVAVHWADGLAAAAIQGRFDRILLHAAVDRLPLPLLDVLSSSGAILYPLQAPPSAGRARVQTMVRTARGFDGAFAQVAIGSSRLQAAQPGHSQVL